MEGADNEGGITDEAAESFQELFEDEDELPEGWAAKGVNGTHSEAPEAESDPNFDVDWTHQ